MSVSQLRDNVLFNSMFFWDPGVEKRQVSLCMSPYGEVLSVSGIRRLRFSETHVHK